MPENTYQAQFEGDEETPFLLSKADEKVLRIWVFMAVAILVAVGIVEWIWQLASFRQMLGIQ